MSPEDFVQSLRNRIRAMNTLWDRALSDLTPDQMNHHERPGVLPLAFSFSHFIRMQDATMSGAILREPPLWVAGNWQMRVGLALEAAGREESVEVMEQQRIGDLEAWKLYQAEVISRTSTALDELTPAVLGEVLIPSLPSNMENIFCAIVIGPNAPLRKLDALECFVYQHGLRHMGEVEHGRALVGLGGMTS